MEFTVSTIKFENSIKIDDMYFSKNFNFDKNNVWLFDGYYVNDENSKFQIEELFNADLKGMFNIISYDRPNKKLLLKNDKLGKKPVYMFYDGKDFIISNLFWNIFFITGLTRLELSLENMKKMLFFNGSFDEESTYFNKVKRISYAKIVEFYPSNQKLVEKRYWDFSLEQDNKYSLRDIYEDFDNLMKQYFSYLKNKHKSECFIIGNSGGLDSRLIMLYAKEFGLKLFPYATLEKKPYFLYSVSYKNIKRIDNVFNTNTKIIYPLDDGETDLYNRAILDIRNNPFGMSQLFKNPVYQIPKNCLNMITGHPGISVGGLVKEDYDNMNYDEFVNFMLRYFGIQGHPVHGYNNRFLLLLKKVFPVQLSSSNIERVLFTDKELNEFKNTIENFIHENSEKSNFEIRQKYAATVLEKWQLNGGFESLSRTKNVYYFYYPVTYEKILRWPKKFIINRVALKYIIEKKSELLGRLPEQYGKNKLQFYLRGSGLEYLKWINSQQIEVFKQKVLKNKNEVFENLFPIKIATDSDIMKSSYALEILKLKMFLDIIVFGNKDIFENEEWEIK